MRCVSPQIFVPRARRVHLPPAARLAIFVPWKQKSLTLLCNFFSDTNDSTGTFLWCSLATVLHMVFIYLFFPRRPRSPVTRVPARLGRENSRHPQSLGATSTLVPRGGKLVLKVYFLLYFLLWQKCICSRLLTFVLFLLQCVLYIERIINIKALLVR